MIAIMVVNICQSVRALISRLTRMISVIDSLQLIKVIDQVSSKQIHWPPAMLAYSKLNRFKKNRTLQIVSQMIHVRIQMLMICLLTLTTTCSQILKILDSRIVIDLRKSETKF